MKNIAILLTGLVLLQVTVGHAAGSADKCTARDVVKLIKEKNKSLKAC